ncbi:hypothetical protein LOC68_20700 [Blastopirellula sp. JC732]|uniref:WD40 repeat domain-containing protein n=1 Tax=Blastopirellula sediminis TaxID=2894196 RepID=A0A9X1SIG8_9BACT|nr:hypothetical protein [Blastopirellula sediminis]MCC9605880.1 hypothetical protein [Blastopirellula sediminis]MCC9630821.1 hypothetical protein [Blastopirellula sediminis]
MLRAILLLSLLAISPAASLAQEQESQSTDDVVPLATIRHYPTLTDVAYSPDGQFVAVFHKPTSGGFFGGSIKHPGKFFSLRRVKTGEETLNVPAGWNGFSFSPDSRQLVWFDNSAVTIADCATGKIGATRELKNVSRVQFQDDGETVVTFASVDNMTSEKMLKVQFWKRADLTPIESKVETLTPLYKPIVSLNGKYLAGYKEQARENRAGAGIEFGIWDIATGEPMQAPKYKTLANQLIFHAQEFTPDSSGICSYPTRQGKMEIWNIEKAESQPFDSWFELERHMDVAKRRPWNDLAPDKVATKEDHKLIIRDRSTQRQLSEVDLETQFGDPEGFEIGYSGQFGPQVYSNGILPLTLNMRRRGRLNIWDLTNYQLQETIEVENPVKRILLSRNGKSLVILMDGSVPPFSTRKFAYVSVWDWPARTERFKIEAPNSPVVSIAISTDGKRLATGSRLPTDQAHSYNLPHASEVKLWNLETGELLQTIQKCDDDPHYMTFSPDGKFLAVASRNDATPENHVSDLYVDVRVWNLETFACEQTFIIEKGKDRSRGLDRVNAITFSPDGKRLLMGGGEPGGVWGQLTLWNLETGQLEFVKDMSYSICALWFDLTGTYFYMVDNNLSLLKVENLKEDWPIDSRPLKRPIAVLGIHCADATVGRRDDQALFAFSAIRMTDASSSVIKLVIVGAEKNWILPLTSPGSARSVQFTPDGGQLLDAGVADLDYRTYILDSNTGREITMLDYHDGFVRFGAGGDLAATISPYPGAGVTLWNTLKGQPIVTMPHPNVQHIQFSPTGDSLVSRSDQEARIWDLSPFLKRD